MPRPAFPTSLRLFQQQFPDEAACREYLETFRWPDGFRHNRRKTPMAAFQTLLGLRSARGPTPGRLIRRSSRDLATIPDQELTTISGVMLNQPLSARDPLFIENVRDILHSAQAARVDENRRRDLGQCRSILSSNLWDRTLESSNG